MKNLLAVLLVFLAGALVGTLVRPFSAKAQTSTNVYIDSQLAEGNKNKATIRGHHIVGFTCASPDVVGRALCYIASVD